MKTLHSAQDAIEQAIEGGYKTDKAENPLFLSLSRTKKYDGNDLTYRDDYKVALDCTFTDPLFWQALGKARGWNNWSDGETHYLGWRENAKRWFLSRMVGGDENKYWESLL